MILGLTLSGMGTGGSPPPAMPSSVVFDFDATQAGSYPGTGQTLANLIAAPADGSAQADNDFWLGPNNTANSSDPTFPGTAGTPAAYFLFDGNQHFTMKAATDFILGLQRTDRAKTGWCAWAGVWTSGATNVSLMGTTAATSSTGWRLNVVTATGVCQMQFRGDTANVGNSSGTAPVLVSGNTYLIIYTWDGSNVRFWVNTRSKTSEALVFNTCVNNSANSMGLCCANASSNRVGNATRLYAAALGNAYIDDADASKIIDVYNARHGRVYA